MAPSKRSIDGVVAAVNAAVLEPERWEAALEKLSRALGATQAALFSPDPGAAATPLVASTHNTRDALADYAANWVDRDAWNVAAATRNHFAIAGAVDFGRSALSAAALRRTAFHSDYLRRYDIGEVMTLKVSDARDQYIPITHLSLFRPTSLKEFDEHDKAPLHALWPHLRRAIRAHYLLSRAQRIDRLPHEMLEALPHPAWVLRSDASIEFANRAACSATASQSWIQTRNGRLFALGDLDAVRLEAGVRSAGRGGAFAHAAGIPSSSGLRYVGVHIVPLVESHAMAVAWPQAAALLMLRLPVSADDRQRWMARLQTAHGLTLSEVRVLERLACGQDPHSIAAELGVSYATVRTHLRALYDKTGCHRQAELVRLGLGA
jgi:DNA-binding CsgD family transcriptional regulator